MDYSFTVRGKHRKDAESEDTDMEFIERKRWLFFGLPFTFTKYTVKEDLITIDTGLLKTAQNDCYMYKVQDVELTPSEYTAQLLSMMGSLDMLEQQEAEKKVNNMLSFRMDESKRNLLEEVKRCIKNFDYEEAKIKAQKLLQM